MLGLHGQYVNVLFLYKYVYIYAVVGKVTVIKLLRYVTSYFLK
jgi:hypothetical protein